MDPQEELKSTISIGKPEKNWTLGSVNIERTESEHATLFTVRGRLCARPDDSFDSSVELLFTCGATSDFMRQQRGRDFPSTK